MSRVDEECFGEKVELKLGFDRRQGLKRRIVVRESQDGGVTQAGILRHVYLLQKRLA